MNIKARGFLGITVLVGGTVLTIVLPAVISGWMVYRAVLDHSSGSMLIHGTLAILQIIAVWNAYRVTHAGLLPVVIPSCIAVLHFIAEYLFHLPTG